MDVQQQYEGNLRPRITILGPEEAVVEWVTSGGQVIWTEGVKPKAGHSFVSQIECTGTFQVRSGYFVDQDGKRHFVMRADPGRLGAILGAINGR